MQSEQIEIPINVAREVFFLAVLAAVLDGFDIQIIGFALPSLTKIWGGGRAVFDIIIASSLLMMSIGTAVGGVVGDKCGRRPLLIGSLALFASATLLATFANSIINFGILRVIASMGMGGAVPNAVALLDEFAPQTRRRSAVTVGMICTPIGGVAAGIASTVVLPIFGWKALFILGGIAPIILCLILFFRLPESPRYLARLPKTAGSVNDRGTSSIEGHGANLFRPELRADTLLIWSAFFCTLASVYCVFNWVPSLLSAMGFDLAATSAALAAFNFGGIAGALIGALKIDRVGTKALTTGTAVIGSAVAVATGLLVRQATGGGAAALLFACGVFIAGLQPMLFAVAANIYPNALKAGGVGSALAFGRTGGVLSGFLGSFLISIGPVGFFDYLATLMAMAAGALILLTRHASERPLVSPQAGSQAS